MHRDLVKNDWHNMRQELVERIKPDDPRAEGPERWQQALTGWATYWSISEPHDDAECPFGVVG